GAARAEGMRARNPMRNPAVAARALATSKARYEIDPTHGWHRNLARLDAWRHRHPSVGQERLYGILESMGIRFEREYRIQPDQRLRGSKKFYVADAAIPDLQIDLEVDGYWHEKSEVVRRQDRIRDATLEANGWPV